MAKQYRVVDHLVEHLAAIGVSHIFGEDGANIEDQGESSGPWMCPTFRRRAKGHGMTVHGTFG